MLHAATMVMVTAATVHLSQLLGKYRTTRVSDIEENKLSGGLTFPYERREARSSPSELRSWFGGVVQMWEHYRCARQQAPDSAVPIPSPCAGGGMSEVWGRWLSSGDELLHSCRMDLPWIWVCKADCWKECVWTPRLWRHFEVSFEVSSLGVVRIEVFFCSPTIEVGCGSCVTGCISATIRSSLGLLDS